jgi:hypothetical protein
MKAILIDSYNKTVQELDLDPNFKMLFQWYQQIKCTIVTVGHYITEHDSIIVDDEGLLKPCDHFFYYDGAHQPFAGNGLVVGVDEEGETVACDITLEEVEAKVKFMSREDVLKSLE